ncbi:MAG: DUF4019 domain-containing protein [Nitrospirota bacterium]|nr:MAG: DUF4019 domain-containing protein [Nitrospirota bacterium]
MSFDEKVAATEAKSWLGLVDDGRYLESWEQSSKLFKNAIGKEQWGRQLSAARNPLGKVINRELSSTYFTTSLPGAPDGEYVVIEFSTIFENKRSAVETVTPMKEKDGRWRVSGYYIR